MGGFFDHADRKATAEKIPDAVVNFLKLVAERSDEVPSDIGKMLKSLYTEFLATIQRKRTPGQVKDALIQGSKNVWDLAGDILDIYIAFSDFGYFSGMKMPREVRDFLQKNKFRDRSDKQAPQSKTDDL